MVRAKWAAAGAAAALLCGAAGAEKMAFGLESMEAKELMNCASPPRPPLPPGGFLIYRGCARALGCRLSARRFCLMPCAAK